MKMSVIVIAGTAVLFLVLLLVLYRQYRLAHKRERVKYDDPLDLTPIRVDPPLKETKEEQEH